jgi:hypothetical protein
MPHQRLIADVGGEIDPETGLPAYREVIWTMMRQSGKTIAVLSFKVHRALAWSSPKPQRIIYTAQTGLDARKKLLEDEEPVLKRSVYWKAVSKTIHSAGQEGWTFKNGSRVSLTASGKGSGHGFSVDQGILDECWEDQDNRREQSMVPAMATIADAQLLVMSTMGTDASTYLNRKVEIGRAAAVKDKGSGIAYFEWSVPLDEDIENPDVWWEYMPALGRTISQAAVQHAFENMEEAEFRRAWCNQATKAAHDRIFPENTWSACCDPRTAVNRNEPVVLCVDVLPDRSYAAVCASDGKAVEVADHRPGTGWVVERCQELLQNWNATLCLDGGGPSASLAPDFENAGVEVKQLNTAGVAAACGQMYDAIADRRVRFRTDPSLDEAVNGLAKRPLGDRFIWSRSTSLADITPFMAGTLAYAQAQIEPPAVDFIAFD